MKICLIAEGKLPIPPQGWGGVEHLIWNFKQQLEKAGDEVVVLNTQDLNEVVRTANEGNFDAVHLHYDQYAGIMPHIQCEKKMITSHYPYLENPEPSCVFLYDFLKNSQSHIVSLSDRIKTEFIRRGIDGTNVSVLPCGIDTQSYALDVDDVLFPDKSIVVGKIEPRKRQAHLQKQNLRIDFVGNVSDQSFDTSDPSYLGEQSKQDIMDNLTAYANMVLLSSGEAHPFVCLEGLAAGLGLVLSEQSTANLDVSQPFITVIPDDKINDFDYLREKIEQNRMISLSMRYKIRQYCYENFDWLKIIKKYKEIINSI
jgi:glycosyltransferase involved in cell wall biosynthesis|tara:strand:- start:749 stop:1687 length:939 start_codon:yes stop_codon:yes gene_type:complete